MMKIKTKQDVKDLIDFMVDEPIWIQIYDDIFANQLISFVDDDGIGYKVKWEDTVNGNSGTDFLYRSELIEKIWRNRTFINKTKQLDRVYNQIIKE